MIQQTTGNLHDRKTNGRFASGKSGNPTGRIAGSKNRLTELRKKLIVPLLPEAVKKLHEAVTEGERWAIELVVTYSIPKPKPVDPEELEEFEGRLLELEQMAR